MCRVILLDADGVLVPPWQFAELLEREYGVTDKDTRQFFGGPFQECLVGKADLLQELPPFLKQWGWTKSTQEFVDLWLRTESVVDDQIVGTVRKLRAAGTRCYLATNQERYRAAYMRTQMGLGEIFDGLFFSCELGYRKPREQYYRAVEGKLGMAGQDICFWDDSPTHVEAARRLGWEAEAYMTHGEFERYWDAKLI